VHIKLAKKNFIKQGQSSEKWNSDFPR